VLDLLQQLHGRIGGGDPPTWVVLMHQSQPGPIDPQHRPGGLGHPQQPGQQIIGFKQRRSELADGPAPPRHPVGEAS
jgi:hypothetical protein